jgi:hypothetical protein
LSDWKQNINFDILLFCAYVNQESFPKTSTQGKVFCTWSCEASVKWVVLSSQQTVL